MAIKCKTCSGLFGTHRDTCERKKYMNNLAGKYNPIIERKKYIDNLDYLSMNVYGVSSKEAYDFIKELENMTTPKEEKILESWLKKQYEDGQYIDGGNEYEKYCLDGEYNLRELVSKVRREAIAEIREKIEEELDLSCVDDRLLGKTDEYLKGYNTSTERWRAKRDCLFSHLTQE